MKELERTRRISISAVIFILILVIGFLTFKRPTYLYDKTKIETLELLADNSYLVDLKTIDENSLIIDVRSPFEFAKGSIENAVNIPSAEILEEKSKELLDDLKEEDKTILLYGSTPSEANEPWLVLSQIGYNNVKILNVNTEFRNNLFVAEESNVENPVTDISAYIANSQEEVKKAQALAKIVPVTKPKPIVKKKTIEVKKKKKAPAEGGC